MLCDVCGRDNPDRLLYCQDCGKRLRSAPRSNPQPGAAQATTPAAGAGRATPGLGSQGLGSQGLGSQAVGAPAVAELAASQGAPPSGHGEPHARRSRPEAPAFSFAPSEPPPPPTPEPARAASHGAGHCDVCGANNAPTHRFCSVCGAALRAAAPAAAPAGAPRPNVGRTWVDGEPPVPQPARAPQAVPQPAPAPLPQAAPQPVPLPQPVPVPQPAQQPAPAPQGRLVAAPVLAIADSIPPSPGTVQCARCQGQNDATARFCKYCGSPLTARVTPDQAPHDVALAGAVVQPAAPGAAAPQAAVALDVPATIQTRAPVVADAALARAAAAPARAAQPAEARQARLVVVTEDGSDGKSFELSHPVVTIGRAEGDILLTDDPYVSPRHARLEQVGGVWQIDDLGSLNGVFVRVKGRRALQKHDLILLGSQVLQFEPVNDEERQLGPVSQHGTRIFGTKPVRRLARLDQRTTAGLVGDVYYVHRDETTLGRELGDIVFTADAFLSRRHAMIRRDPASGEFSLEDLESSNGTFVAIRGRSPIEQGDRIRIGQHLFRFELGLGAGAARGGRA